MKYLDNMLTFICEVFSYILSGVKPMPPSLQTNSEVYSQAKKSTTEIESESKYQDLMLSQKFVRIMRSSACNIVNGQKAANLGQP